MPAHPSTGRRILPVIVFFTALLIAGFGGHRLYLIDQQTHARHERHVADLVATAANHLENRRWPEAATVLDELEALEPGSQVLASGRQRISAGIAEEQQQFIGYWTGQARAELEAGRWAAAEAAARQVLEKYPAEKDATALIGQISTTRAARERQQMIVSIRKLVDDREWEKARSALPSAPLDPELLALRDLIQAGLEKATADRSKAAALLEQARALDNGTYNPHAIAWLREAASLDPTNAEITAALEKTSTYGRTLRVPEDYPSPADAIAAAKENDRVVLGPATWVGPLTVSASIEIQGSGPGTTLIECPAAEGSAITLTPAARMVRISGMTFRHQSFAIGTERYATATVQGGTAIFNDCRFLDASGHGLAVIEGGKVTASRCRFANNGWNGASANGAGTTLEVRDSEALANFEHGIESWENAAITISGTRCENNSRNGIHADSGAGAVTIENNQLLTNREFGLVLDTAASGKVSGNTATGNLLGGYFIRPAGFTVSGNQGQPPLTEADLPAPN